MLCKTDRYRLYCDLCSPFIGGVKDAGGDAAEGNGFNIIFCAEIQRVPVAVGQILKHGFDHSIPGIKGGFAVPKTVIRHRPHVQGFYANNIILIGYLGRCFIQVPV